MEREAKQKAREEIEGFSPLAGIKFVESLASAEVEEVATSASFSPLAGIKFVESQEDREKAAEALTCFSPLAGIKFVERAGTTKFPQGSLLVSVPLRGLSSWKAEPLAD